MDFIWENEPYKVKTGGDVALALTEAGLLHFSSVNNTSKFNSL